MTRVHTVVVGGGQAGLAVSHELTAAGVEHVVLERGRVGQTWRGRWDSFCLVTPNWTVQLPGHPYDGDAPDAFMPRDDLVAYLERYARAVAAPVREGVTVTGITVSGDGFVLRTSDGEYRAGNVVLATGAYQKPHRPAAAAALPPQLLQVDVGNYTSAGALPEGRVLVVGSGQSGCQIAEELHEAGREVVLACGRAPWVERRIGGHDLVWWLIETGFFDAPPASLGSPAERLDANPQASGHHGGRDLHYRTLRAQGVTLAGRFAGVQGGRVRFAADLADSVRWGDERRQRLIGLVRKTAAERGLPAPDVTDPPPFDAAAPETMDLAGLGAVIFAGGFRPDYGWLRFPQAFDEMGFPKHAEGASTVVPGLYFVGVHFLRKRKSSLLYGVGEDAAIIARAIGRSRDA